MNTPDRKARILYALEFAIVRLESLANRRQILGGLGYLTPQEDAAMRFFKAKKYALIFR